MQRINSYLHSQKKIPYVLNLDPAVYSVPFESNIDIRDSINYKEVMKQYNLGPNGGILTSLNLFSTKIDQVIALLEKRTQPPPPAEEPEPSTVEFMTSGGKDKQAAPAQQLQVKHILVDTPGQIEVFVWSASGEILLSSLASTFPTVIAYIIDTPRTTSTSTFMSNMLYACSILYKTKLPMILVFNKRLVLLLHFLQMLKICIQYYQQKHLIQIFGRSHGQVQKRRYKNYNVAVPMLWFLLISLAVSEWLRPPSDPR